MIKSTFTNNDKNDKQGKATHSGVLPFFTEDSKTKIILVSNIRGDRWTIPKGYIETGENAMERALKEAWEEAGIKGKITGKTLGTYIHPKETGDVRVILFPMKVKRVENRWPEKKLRDRKIVSPQKAIELITIPVLKSLLVPFIEQLKS